MSNDKWKISEGFKCGRRTLNQSELLVYDLLRHVADERQLEFLTLVGFVGREDQAEKQRQTNKPKDQPYKSYQQANYGADVAAGDSAADAEGNRQDPGQHGKCCHNHRIGDSEDD